MRKKSDIAASRVTKIVIGLGFIAAALAPFGGAALAAWSTGAAALAGLGLGAAAPLAAAGAFGGFILGAFAAPVIAIGSIAVGLLAGATTKAIGSTLEWMAGGSKAETAAQPKADVQHNIHIDIAGAGLNSKKLGESFGAAKQERQLANQNKPQPKLQKLLRFGM
ncbi:MAG: hypothetical protein PSY14_12140 [bacterium]|nr:hypothetical protein [bacterium]